jgi:hypothetical protein
MDERKFTSSGALNPSEIRWHGIDYLRTFISMTVVAWHGQLFGMVVFLYRLENKLCMIWPASRLFIKYYWQRQLL